MTYDLLPVPSAPSPPGVLGVLAVCIVIRVLRSCSLPLWRSGPAAGDPARRPAGLKKMREGDPMRRLITLYVIKMSYIYTCRLLYYFTGLWHCVCECDTYAE